MKTNLKYSVAIVIIFATSVTLNAQSLVSINPDNAQQGESLYVEITGQGTHFSDPGGNTIWLSQGSSTIYSPTYYLVNDTFMAAFFNIPGDAAIGLHDLNVYNDMDGTLALIDCFRIVSFTPPELVSINPDTFQQGQSLMVAISGQGTHFTFQQGSGTQVWFGQGSTTCVLPVSDTLLFTRFDIARDAATGGLQDLQVYNDIDGMLSLYDCFRITPYNPTLLSVTPNGTYQGQSLSVRISGQNTAFEQGSGVAVWFSQGDSIIVPRNTAILGNEISNIPATGRILMADFDIPADANSGLWDVHTFGQIDGLLTIIDGFMIARPGDLTCDGIVNFSDFAIVADNWLEGTGP